MLIYKPEISHIKSTEANAQQIIIDMLRLDKIDVDISGNKWFKLKYNLKKAKAENKSTIVTFGGAFSNHIVATAVACKLEGLKSVGIIRGEKQEILNPSLKKATDFGMELHYISREDYKNKIIPYQLNDTEYIVPEGGANLLGVKGCEEIITKELQNYDIICCAAGTGTTAAGILNSLTENQKLYVFPALKNGGFLKEEILAFSSQINLNKLELISNYDFSGYGKITKELVDFVTDFKSQQGIQLDYIYTGKMVFGVFDLIKEKKINPKSKILLLHSGGIQGNAGIEERFKKYFNKQVL